jgi:cleavage and polyadenylation specificity factor subunit 1
MVRKKDGGWGPCGDFRRLNVLTTDDKYPLPNMGDLASRLDGCNIFSKLDLQKGYFQVPVAAADVKKTAVITPFGLFEFLRMPFGLKNAGMTFQRLMDWILFDIPFIFVYLDDILVASRSVEEHQQHLQQVLHRLQDNGLVINAGKCVWGQSQIEFLGHSISVAGVAPLQSRVAAIQKFPPPATVQQLQAFLGLFNFYRRFVPAAAAVVRPLTDALRGNPAGNRVAASYESGVREHQSGVGGGNASGAPCGWRRNIASYGCLSHTHRGRIAAAAVWWALETIGILFQEAFGGRRAVQRV